MTYEFTASDGKRYRTTGEFRHPAIGELFVGLMHSVFDLQEGKARVAKATSSTDPCIVVEPVPVAYEVTVALDQVDFEFYKKLVSPYSTATIAMISIAIQNGNYKEVPA